MPKYLVIALLFLAACGSPEAENDLDLSRFMVPCDTVGLVYQYATNDKAAPVYYDYYLQVKDKDKRNYLITNRYNQDLVVEQLTRESISDAGLVLVDSRTYTTDSNGVSLTRKTQIRQGLTFPFQPVVSDSLAYRYEIIFADSDSTADMILTRDRFFQGITDHEQEGKTYRCAYFKGAEVITVTPRDGGVFREERQFEEYYAEGIGLIFSKKWSKDSEISYETKFVKSMRMDDFLQLNPAPSK